MITLKKIKRYIFDKRYRFTINALKGFYNRIPDEKYLKKKFKLYFGYDLDFDNVQTFNEKIQWLKLYNRNPLFTSMADKIESKKYVASIIGDEYVIKTIGEPWDSFDDVDFDSLPDKFVLKTNHDSGGVKVIKDKNSIDKRKLKKFFNKHLKFKYFYHCREWPYKDIKPKIFAEEYMQDGDNKNLPVYKILCFNGIPKIIQTIQNDKQPNESIDYFDTEWNLLDLRQNFPNSVIPLSKPQNLSEMLDLAAKLSKGLPTIRTDFYVINGKVYFSELTFFSDAGFAEFHPNSWDKILGDLIILPKKQ